MTSPTNTTRHGQKLNETLPNLLARYETMAKQSTYADLWMELMLGCDGWAIEATDPPMRWDDHPAHRRKPINTTFPLLFISNTFDPVTPLRAGVKMAKKFVNAGFIEQMLEGHCSLSSPSVCTLKKVKEYFAEGKVPDVPEWGRKGREVVEGKWERCERSGWPWKDGVEVGGWEEGEGRREGKENEDGEERKGGDEGEDGAEVEEERRLLRAWNEVMVVAAGGFDFWGQGHRRGGLEVDWMMLRELEQERLRGLA